MVVNDTLLQRNDGIVRYSDSFGAYLRATLCNVAVTDTVLLA
jgi:hypothetical protein